MQMGGFDIDVGNGENSSWQWHEEQQWNQSSWENTWENNRQTGDNTSETPVQNDQAQDNGYQYDSDIENGTQDNISNGMVYSRITLTGITAVNGTIILSGIIILRIIMSRIIMPRIITFRVIMPGIIILHGTLNLRQITICR